MLRVKQEFREKSVKRVAGVLRTVGSDFYISSYYEGPDGLLFHQCTIEAEGIRIICSSPCGEVGEVGYPLNFPVL